MTQQTKDLIMRLIEADPRLGLSVISNAGFDYAQPNAVEIVTERKAAVDDILGAGPQG